MNVVDEMCVRLYAEIVVKYGNDLRQFLANQKLKKMISYQHFLTFNSSKM